MNWAVMPYLGNLQQTTDAVADVLAQTLPDVRLLLIDQGSSEPLEIEDPRIYHWHHDPPLPSLSATWNRALRMVWECGGVHAWVVNNDVRLLPYSYETLLKLQSVTGAWFITGCGVTADDFAPTLQSFPCALPFPEPLAKGGPDFSCFVITRACHDAYPFDEGFRPGYCEDLDTHRRLLLDGHGDKIFSVNLPFLHYASGTLKAMTPEKRAKWEAQITAGSRAHYRAKWGGDVNAETYTRPFDPTSAQVDVTTPELQHGAPV